MMSHYPVKWVSGLRVKWDLTLELPTEKPKVSAFPMMINYLMISNEDALAIIKTDFPDREWRLADMNAVMEFQKDPPIEWFEAIRGYHRENEDIAVMELNDRKITDRQREYVVEWSPENKAQHDVVLLWSLFHLPSDSRVYFMRTAHPKTPTFFG